MLRELYSIHSLSGQERKMRNYLKQKIRERKATFTQDFAGNLFITKGEAETYPCVVAHIDQVQHFHPKDFKTIILDDTIIGWSNKHKKQCGLGADDKNGIFIALNCLERYDNIKVAFFVGEEIGCVGSSQADLSFFKDCRFIIEPDRRGNNDLITTMCGVDVCSTNFIDSFDYQKFGYRIADGSVTDVLTLIENGVGLSCINLSCGYHHPHTDAEVTVLSELENCQNLVFDIIENCTEVYPFEYIDPWEQYYSRYDNMTDDEYERYLNWYYGAVEEDWESWEDYEKKHRFNKEIV